MFQFGEDKLVFALSDETGRVEGSAFYEKIDPEPSSTVTVNAGRRYFPPVILVAVLAVMAAASFGLPYIIVASLPLFILIAIWALRFSRLVSVTFTILSVPGHGASGRIRIIKDKQHDGILERIKSARIARIRRLYMAVNPASHPAEEAKKFKWLLEHGVIDEAEYRAAMSELEQAAQSPGSNGEGPEPTWTMN